MSYSIEETISFWKWFETISDSLSSRLNDEKILRDLDDKIKNLGPFDWEVGPLEKDILYLAISPNLNEQLLVETKEIVNHAPRCKGWSFLYAKPQKNYSPTWRMLDENKRTIIIDTSKWDYILYRFEDGTFALDIKINGTQGSSDFQRLAVDIALTNLLGEEKYMKLINSVTIIDDFDKIKDRETSLKFLNEHIDKVIRNR